jgi:hypothetical protein
MNVPMAHLTVEALSPIPHVLDSSSSTSMSAVPWASFLASSRSAQQLQQCVLIDCDFL